MKYKELDKINGIMILTRAPNNGKKTMYYCLCHCGNLFKASQSDLHSKHTTSCGCIQHYNRGKATLIHGQSDTKLYYVYKTMRNRRSNINITYNGMTKTATEWAEYLGVRRKWDVDRLFNQPYRSKHESR